jgi:hypothetical protein
MSKLDDIDYLSGLIYEYLYQKIQSRPIESTMLLTNFLEDLTIIKKMYKGKQLNDVINNVFNTNLSYSGFYESAYVFKRLNNPQTDILIREYPLNQELNPNTSLNVDKIINYLLSDLVIHKKTKNILINICNIDIPTSELEIFIKKYPEIKVKNMLSVSIREHFYKLITLRECLEKENNIEIYKDCIFQVLHCLDVIQSMYPSFRHNNLKIDTILMYKKSEKKNTYTLNKKNYAFTSAGDIKITNFLQSSIKDYVENISIEQNYLVSGSETPDVNALEVAFSPTNEVDDDIIASLGYFNIGDYIGDPRQISSSATSYPDLNTLAAGYFQKYYDRYDLYDYIRLIKFFDNSLFKMIKDFVPARTNLRSGVVVKQHLLERNKYPQPMMDTYQYQNSIYNTQLINLSFLWKF